MHPDSHGHAHVYRDLHGHADAHRYRHIHRHAYGYANLFLNVKPDSDNVLYGIPDSYPYGAVP